MKHRNKLLFFLLLPWITTVVAQPEQYEFRREISGISDQWHDIVLPDELFGNINHDFSDLRIYGFTENNDTAEAAYLIYRSEKTSSIAEVNFQTINISHNASGYYFTFDLGMDPPINRIDLHFNRDNFDWRTTLEGSQDNVNWYTVVEDYRILSIKNNLTDYQFTRLTFPDIQYRYYRIAVHSKEDPQFKHATISLKKSAPADYLEYDIAAIRTMDDKRRKSTVIELDLKNKVPVSSLKISMKNDFDYYRPAYIEYLADSFRTEKGMQYNYRHLASKTISSFEENEISFPGTILQRLRITIKNNDNEPLTLDSVVVNGSKHILLARFVQPGKYYLYYGNKSASSPHYELQNVASAIPPERVPLKVGEEVRFDQHLEEAASPLFENKLWLWVIMGIIILLLGWFTIGMMKKS